MRIFETPASALARLSSAAFATGVMASRRMKSDAVCARAEILGVSASFGLAN
jgi:hypothetical protein